MREGTLSPRQVPEHCKQPQSREPGALHKDAALGATSLPILGEHQRRHPSASRLPALGDGTKEQRGKGKAAASVSTRCLWDPSDQMQAGFRSLLAD